MTIKITYKNGTMLMNKVHYVHAEDGKLYFTRVMNPAPVVQTPTIIPLEYVESFKVIVEGEEE